MKANLILNNQELKLKQKLQVASEESRVSCGNIVCECVCTYKDCRVVDPGIRASLGVIGTNKPHHPSDKVIALPAARRHNL